MGLGFRVTHSLLISTQHDTCPWDANLVYVLLKPQTPNPKVRTKVTLQPPIARMPSLVSKLCLGDPTDNDICIICIYTYIERERETYTNIYIYIYATPPLKTYLLLANHSLRTRFD